MSRYQKSKTYLDFTEARDSEWQWHQLHFYSNKLSTCVSRHHQSFSACVSLLKTPTHTHTRLTALFPGLPGWAGTRKVKPIWILLKQETVSGNGISWAICKSAPHSTQITMPAPTTQFFTGWMPFMLPNQHRQSTEGISTEEKA